MQEEKSNKRKLLAMLMFTAIAVLLINVIYDLKVLILILPVIMAALFFQVAASRIRLHALLFMGAVALGPALVQALSIGDTVMFRVSVFGLPIHVFREGLHRGTLSFLRITECMGILGFFMGRAGLSGFVQVLRLLPFPGALTEVLLFAVKFIHIFKEEGDSIRKAQKARLGYAGVSRSLRSAGHLGEALLGRAFDRSCVLAKAMKSRGCGERKEGGIHADT